MFSQVFFNAHEECLFDRQAYRFFQNSLVTLLKVREKLLKTLPKNPRTFFGPIEGTFDTPDENLQPTNEEFLDQSSKLFKHHIFFKKSFYIHRNISWIRRLMFWRPWRIERPKKLRPYFKPKLRIFFLTHKKKDTSPKKLSGHAASNFHKPAEKFCQKFLKPSSPKMQVFFLKTQFEWKIRLLKLFMGHGERSIDNRTKTDSFKMVPKCFPQILNTFSKHFLFTKPNISSRLDDINFNEPENGFLGKSENFSINFWMKTVQIFISFKKMCFHLKFHWARRMQFRLASWKIFIKFLGTLCVKSKIFQRNVIQVYANLLPGSLIAFWEPCVSFFAKK